MISSKGRLFAWQARSTPGNGRVATVFLLHSLKTCTDIRSERRGLTRLGFAKLCQVDSNDDRSEALDEITGIVDGGISIDRKVRHRDRDRHGASERLAGPVSILT